jgi:hypothetical protein
MRTADAAQPVTTSRLAFPPEKLLDFPANDGNTAADFLFDTLSEVQPMTLWIARLWFAAATVLFVVAAVYPMRFVRALNYARDGELADPRTVLFFQVVAAYAAIGGVLGFIESWIR